VEAFVVAPAGFLLAVLWFDLMFDVQVARAESPAPAAVESIGRYYRRVTTDARPMNLLVALAMLATLVAVVVELADEATAARWVSLGLIVGPVLLARARTVSNAVTLGAATDAPAAGHQRARAVLRDHVACFACITVLVTIQLATV
jgi:hypothetical protein